MTINDQRYIVRTKSFTYSMTAQYPNGNGKEFVLCCQGKDVARQIVDVLNYKYDSERGTFDEQLEFNNKLCLLPVGYITSIIKELHRKIAHLQKLDLSKLLESGDIISIQLELRK